MSILDALYRILRSKPKTRLAAKPRHTSILEVEVLEDRIAPAAFTWISTETNETRPGASWAVGTNWRNLDTNQPGVPGRGDTATITANAVVSVRSDYVVGQLTISGSAEFTIRPDASLTVTTAGGENGEYEQIGQSRMNVNGSLVVDGSIDVHGTNNATINNAGTISAGGTFDLNDQTTLNMTAAGAYVWMTTLNIDAGSRVDVQQSADFWGNVTNGGDFSVQSGAVVYICGNMVTTGTLRFNINNRVAGGILVQDDFTIGRQRGGAGLRVQTTGGAPNATDTFTLVSFYGNLTNNLGLPRFNLGGTTFRSSTGPALPVGGAWKIAAGAGANAAPAGADNAVTTLQNAPYTFCAADFGFTDPSDETADNFLAVKIASLPASGALANNGVALSAGDYVSISDINAGHLVFTPGSGGTGYPYTSFTFAVQDDGGTLYGSLDTDPDPKTMTINVMNSSWVNHAPAGTDNTVTALENTSYFFTSSDFGFTDPSETSPNSFARVKITTLPTGGTLTDNGIAVNAGDFVSVGDINAGLLEYAPAPNASGSAYDSMTAQVCDDGGTDNGGSDIDATPRTLTIDVTRDAPTANDGDYSALENQTLTVSSEDGLLSYVNDPGDDTLVISAINGSAGNVGVAITTAQGGSLTVNADGSFTYVPDTDFSDDDGFTYTVTDGTDSSTATVTIHVVNVLASDAEFSTLHDDVLSVSSGSGLLASADDADDDTLSVTAVNGDDANVGVAITTDNGGTLTVNANGSFSYTPAAGFAGDDWFSYTVSDGDDHSSTAWVVIHVTNTAPTASDSAYSVAHDHTLTVTGSPTPNLLYYVTDLDNDDLSVVAIDDDPDAVGAAHETTAGGSVTVNSDGTFEYDPPAHWVGDDTFVATYSDGVTTVSATVTIHVTNTSAPTASDAEYWVTENGTLTVPGGGYYGLLDGAVDEDGDTLTIVAINDDPDAVGNLIYTSSTSGLTVESDGTFVYYATNAWTGDDTFTFTVSDGITSVTKTCTIHVTAP